MQYISSSCDEMRNLFLSITYDGSYFHGWQIQENALTVQEVFQKSLRKIIGNNFEIKGCSRTDSGVHANMYCMNVRTEHKIEPVRFKHALNRFLPSSIAVNDCKLVENDFHARYSCKSKQYIYKIWNAEIRNPFLEGYALHYRYPLDTDMLNKSVQSFVGSHDFSSFCTLDRRKAGNLTRNIKAASVTRDGDMVVFTVEADGFLYNMVRIMVGTLLRIAQGKIPADGIIDIIEAKDRSKAGPTAPACGLYLNKVIY
ncbi:MAG: tRNA pseudouridine(38-40) synthase TruA [Bacillota bacterium]|nr:tRNA pseudouridine(38-40) synthase TruA [Bacillota bacterium]